MPLERQLRPLINVLVVYRIGLFFKSTTGKYMTTLEHFHFFNTVPFDS